ncbi:MAG: amidase [Bauldia sp.]|nr:amidase [Bauldia sp.]
MQFKLEETTIADIHAAFRAGTLDSATLTQMYLDRISAYDQDGPVLNAFITLNPDAVAEARKLDEAFASGGKFVGPLHGIPIAIKDQAEIKGLEASFGSIALKGYVATEDATIVTKLREAGAVIIGKTTMPDFAASWWGFGSVHGETKCPYALDRDSGGSSGGTGSAIAANLAAVGIGEDTGGSIRLPSSANNLVGIRVTPGMISRKGLSPLLVPLDTAGPMARTVTDAAIVLDTLVGYDPADPYTCAVAVADHKGSYTRHLEAGALKGARLGVLKEAFGSDDDPDCAQVNTVVRKAIEQMADAGAELVELSLPGLADYIAETSLYISRSRTDVNRFLKQRPSLAHTALETIVEAELYHKGLELIPALIEEGPEDFADDPEYFRKAVLGVEFQQIILNMIAANALDGLCYPACQVLTPTHEALRSGRWTVLSYPTNTTIASQSRIPSICVPAGFSDTGVPVGMEIVAPPYHEPDLIRLGYAFEQLTHWRKPPVSAPPL